MGMNVKGPFLYDSLDKENPKNGTKQESSIDLMWVPAVVAISLIVLVIATWLYLARLDSLLLQTYNEGEIAIIQLQRYGIPAGFFIIILLAAFYTARYIYLKSNRELLINVSEHQTTIREMENYTQAFTDRFFDAFEKRMERSLFAGVSTLTWDQSTHSQGNTDVPLLEDVSVATPDDPLPVLLEMQSRGLINRSGSSLLVGFTHEEP